MQLPTIHSNGTSKAELISSLRAACDTLRKAIEVYKDTAPNGRDYYPQGKGAFKAAWLEFQGRLSHLENVLNETEAFMFEIDQLTD